MHRQSASCGNAAHCTLRGPLCTTRRNVSYDISFDYGMPFAPERQAIRISAQMDYADGAYATAKVGDKENICNLSDV